jgi:hypothetical protein
VDLLPMKGRGGEKHSGKGRVDSVAEQVSDTMISSLSVINTAPTHE